MLDLKPLKTRLIVKQDELKSTLIILHNAKSLELTEGEVIAAGQEVSLVGPGDRVYYGKYAGVPIERNSEKYMLMDEADLLCLIEKPKVNDTVTADSQTTTSAIAEVEAVNV